MEELLLRSSTAHLHCRLCDDPSMTLWDQVIEKEEELLEI